MNFKRVKRFVLGGIFLLVAVGAIGMVGWAADWVTLQSERTIYTVECVAGRWDRTLLTPQFRTEPPNALVLKVS